MRKAIIILAVGLLAYAPISQAQPQQHNRPVILGTNTSGSATFNLNGNIEAVYVASSDSSSTGEVAVSYTPLAGSASVNVATNSVADERVWRPVVDSTSVAGADLTSDPPRLFALAGETLTFAVSGSPTGLTWTCVIVTETEK